MNIKFNELGWNDCYESLRIYYDTKPHLMAVFNLKYNKILVIELKSIYSNPYFDKLLEVKMNRDIIKSLIYSKMRSKSFINWTR